MQLAGGVPGERLCGDRGHRATPSRRIRRLSATTPVSSGGEETWMLKNTASLPPSPGEGVPDEGAEGKTLPEGVIQTAGPPSFWP